MVAHLTQGQLDALAQALRLDEDNPANNYVNYYTLLASYGETYGLLALDVAASQSLSGRVARAFAAARAKELGTSLTSETWAKISADLAKADFEARSKLAREDNHDHDNSSSIDLPIRFIQEYHEQVFAKYGLDITAWTAYIPLQLAGSTEEKESKWEELKQPGVWSEIVQGSWTAVSTILGQAFSSNIAATIMGYLGGGWVGAIGLNILDAATDTNPVDVWIRNIVVASGAVFGIGDSGTISKFELNLPDGGKLIGGNGEPTIKWSEWLNGFGQSADDDPDLTGTARDDVILGYSGDDRLDGGDGNDTLHGGSGNDVLIGGGR